MDDDKLKVLEEKIEDFNNYYDSSERELTKCYIIPSRITNATAALALGITVYSAFSKDMSFARAVGVFSICGIASFVNDALYSYKFEERMENCAQKLISLEEYYMSIKRDPEIANKLREKYSYITYDNEEDKFNFKIDNDQKVKIKRK